MANYSRIVEEIQTLEKKVDKILYYLESDPMTNQKGIVEKTEINAKDISNIKEYIKILEAKAGVLGFVGGLVVSFIVWIFKLIN